VLFLFLIGSGAWLYDVKPETLRPTPLKRIGGPLRLHRAVPRLRPTLGRLF